MAKNIQIKDRSVPVQIWDTAGQDAFRPIYNKDIKIEIENNCAKIQFLINLDLKKDNIIISLYKKEIDIKIFY